MQTFMSAEKVCTLRGMPRLRISAIISSALRSCWCDPHCARKGHLSALNPRAQGYDSACFVQANSRMSMLSMQVMAVISVTVWLR